MTHLFRPFSAWILVVITGLPWACLAQPSQTHGQIRIPVYRSKIDSIKIAALDLQLHQEHGQKRVNVRRADSLAQARWTLYRESVTFKNIYRPNRGYITTDSLEKMTDLSEVKLVSVYRKDFIPDIVWKCRNITALELVSCDIDRLPERLNELDSLVEINIYNSRSVRRLKLARNDRVKRLRILNERPGGLPRSYRKLRALEYLDLSENKLRRFPNGARHNRHLRELSLQRNVLTLKGRIAIHRHLERLSLHENAIERVPGSIANLKKLKRLNFNINTIHSVSPRIARLKNLEFLSFYRNALTEIPAGVYKLESLIAIDLFYNAIENIDPAFARWQDLEVLYLSHNKLMALPENLDTLSKLEELHAWDNRLEQLPESIGNLKSLRVLRVNKNYLHRLPASFAGLNQLAEIDFSHNYISDFPEYLFRLEDLYILALTGNPYDDATRERIAHHMKPLRDRQIYLHVSE